MSILARFAVSKANGKNAGKIANYEFFRIRVFFPMGIANKQYFNIDVYGKLEEKHISRSCVITRVSSSNGYLE